MTLDYAKVLAGMREAQTRPRYTGPTINVVSYWRPSHRHHWRRSATQVNVPDEPNVPVTWRADGEIEYADIPYDWQTWTPPRTARILPGLVTDRMAKVGTP